MAELVLVRVDERLIHGCVCATWAPTKQASRIIAVDDVMAKDPFIAGIMISSGESSSGAKCSILTMNDAVTAWKENQFGDGKVLLVFKSVEDAYNAYGQGIEYEDLQLGWTNPSKDRVKINTSMNLSSTDVELIRKLQEKNIRVYIQYSLQFDAVSFEDGIKGKF